MLSGLSNCKMLKRFACCFSWLRKAKWFKRRRRRRVEVTNTHAQCSSFSCPKPHSKLNRIHLHVLYGFLSLPFFLLLLLLLILLLRLIFHLIPVRFTWEYAQHIDWLGECMNGCEWGSVSVWGCVSEYITIRYFVFFHLLFAFISKMLRTVRLACVCGGLHVYACVCECVCEQLRISKWAKANFHTQLNWVSWVCMRVWVLCGV